jgi:hypothetical protein
VEVFFDHLAHGGRDCPSDCLERGRLEGVQHWLLLPFRAARTAA